MKNALKKNQAKLVAFLLCLLMAVVCMGPVLFSFFTSIKSELEIMSGGFSFLPSQPTLENYSELFSSQYSASYPIMKWFTNSLIVAVAQTVLVVLIPFLFWLMIILLVVGLFTDFRYSFRGPNLGNDKINDTISKASDMADSFKAEVIHGDSEENSQK